MVIANRPTWAEIHLNNLAFNFHSVKSFVGTDLKYMAVVKANAYGHSAVECSKKLEAEGIDWLGVALPEEGLELRQAGIQKPILCLGGFWSGQENLILDYKLTPTIFRLEIAEKLNQAAKQRGVLADVHIKVDTGMNRIGVRFDELKAFVAGLKKLKNLRIDGIMTHFATADNLSENDFTNLQIARFFESVEILKENGFDPTYMDLANSPGAIAHPNALGNMARLGGILYGLGDDVLPKNIAKPELKPVLTLHSKISLLKRVPIGDTLGYSRTFIAGRNSLIATIPIGYQDGYPRALSNYSRVIINGEFANVVGRVSMDWTMIDVTDIPNVKNGDEVILIGESKGSKITVEELANKTDTISYEITCGISRRVTRVYRD